MATLVSVTQDTATAPPLAIDAKPVTVLSGSVAFVPTWDGGNPTLVSIISPVLLVPIRSNLVFESRAAFEGDFQRRNGNSGDFTGAITKSLDYMELDYAANRYITVTAGRFLTPFNIFNERLYPNWIRNTQTDPDIGGHAFDNQSLEHGIGQRIEESVAGHGQPDRQLRRREREDKINDRENEISGSGDGRTREAVAELAGRPGEQCEHDVEDQSQQWRFRCWNADISGAQNEEHVTGISQRKQCDHGQHVIEAAR